MGVDYFNKGVYIVEPNVPVIGDIWFDTVDGILKTWNGYFWQGALITIDDFINVNGDTIRFLASIAGGGSSAPVSASANLLVADLNSATTKSRKGEHQISINTTASSFAAFSNATTANSPRYQLQTKGGFFVSYTWQQAAPAIGIDFANDPVLACAGLVTYTTTAVVNPATGIYHRLPRVGETAFVKYVVREGGAETVQDTAVPYTSNLVGYLKTALLWDGDNDTMYFITGANGVYDIKPIANFSTTYPSTFAALFHSGLYLGRNGAGLVPATTTMRIDKAERYVFNNYLNCI